MIRTVDVTNILSALKNSERQTRKEVPSGKKTCSRTKSETGAVLQKIADLLKLWNAMSLKDFLFAKCLECSLIFDASVLWHEIDNGVEYSLPSIVLGLGVRNQWYRIAIFISERDFGDDLTTRAIFLVSETRMIHIKIRLVLGHQMITAVELGCVTREPRILDAHGIIGEQRNTGQWCALSEISYELKQTLPGHVNLHQYVELASFLATLSRFNVGHSTLEIFHSLQDPRETADSIAHSHHQCCLLNRRLCLRTLGDRLSQHHFFLGETIICKSIKFTRYFKVLVHLRILKKSIFFAFFNSLDP